MNALIINCSHVRTGATAEIVKIITEQLSTRYDVRRVITNTRNILTSA